MPTLDKLADEVIAEIAKTGVWLSIPQRKVLWRIVVNKFKTVVPEAQQNLHFTDPEQAKNKEQCMKILALLKERRSEGATNIELNAICINHTARVSDLRQAPHHYRIEAKRESGRIWRYRLSPEDY